ncbi:two-component system sensor histidine kinase NtrB [Halobellus limi]|uniref:histidine kinase n=1 Tax=Halobellus limi TaxID=699433 RepID=A0A1H5SN42_9EURY|nr:PAS domain-containing sensor histidine kinase [Halobellus limi]QCC47541.1 PAS domain S-box protein [Halobellus limi]SEF51945.1 PAS domain S-box-containing protein [Halobellus limi]
MEFQTVEQYRALIDHSTDVIVLFDKTGVIQFASPAVETMLGYDPNELIGEQAFSLIHPDDREQAVEAFNQIVGAPSQSTKKQEHRLRHADGSWVWAESVTTNRTESDIEGFVINTREITERKRNEKQLEKRTEQLEALNRVVRHDIRNDMSVILGWGEQLQKHVTDEGQDALDRVLRKSRHVIELTEISRDFVESLVSDDTTEVKPVDLQQYIKTELAAVRESYPNAQFDVSGDISDVSVRANEMLSSVFRNLFENAVQHNNEETPVITVTYVDRDETVRVRIADNGPGIPDEQKEQIFGKGKRGLDSSGSGIGLYLVHTLTDQFGGDVWVEDNDPKGAVFIVELQKAE